MYIELDNEDVIDNYRHSNEAIKVACALILNRVEELKDDVDSAKRLITSKEYLKEPIRDFDIRWMEKSYDRVNTEFSKSQKQLDAIIVQFEEINKSLISLRRSLDEQNK